MREKAEDRGDWQQWGGRRTEGALVERVEVRGGDRLLSLHLSWQNRIGDAEKTELIWEFSGVRTNAVLVSPHGQVLDVLRPVTANVNRYRTVLPGRPYIPPPVGARMRLDEPWAWEAVDGTKTVREFLTSGFLASSRLLAEEILRRAGINGDMPVGECDRVARERLESRFRSILARPAPHLLLDENGIPAGYCGVFPTHRPKEQVVAANSFSEAAATFWRTRNERDQENDRLYNDLARWRAEHSKLLRQRANLEGDRAGTERADELSRLADVIMANLDTIPDGAGEVEVRDWFGSPDARAVIRLDPTRPVALQAEQLYRRARKLRDSRPHLDARMQKTERGIERLAASIREAEARLGTDDRKERRGHRVQETTEGRDAKNPDHGIRPRRYRTREGGWLVMVGRTDDENDILSLKVAASEDLWFHAHGCPGSHVVLRKEGRKEQPSRQAVAEAAAVAAYWSKARGSSKVGVSYTLAKYVTKPRGSPAGTVSIRREKLLVVPPALLPMADEAEEAAP